MAADKSKTLVTVLIVIVLVLLAIIAYAFLVSPKISGYSVNKQVEGYQIALSEIARVASQCQQSIPIQIGENQTINLIAVECLPQELLQQIAGTQPAEA